MLSDRYGLRASPDEPLGRVILRVLANVAYYGFARHLPYSVRPYAFGAKRIRYLICRHMLASCGRNVNIEHGALLNSGSQIHVGDNSGIGLEAFISGPLVIGRNVIMGPRCTFLSINFKTARTDMAMIDQGHHPPRPPVVEDDVWIGANVTVLPGRHIGEGSIVAAGSVVSRDVPAYSVVAGNPARVIRFRPDAPTWARGDASEVGADPADERVESADMSPPIRG